MGVAASPSEVAVPYHPVEHHHFQFRVGWLLFDVNVLTVLRSCPLDGVALQEAAGGVASLEELVERLVATGADPAEARSRVELLAERRFLLPEGDQPDLPPVGRPSAHATFMVNVAQRCNLTCPHCYVNKGPRASRSRGPSTCWRGTGPSSARPSGSGCSTTTPWRSPVASTTPTCATSRPSSTSTSVPWRRGASRWTTGSRPRCSSS